MGYKVNISLPDRKITIFPNLWYKSGSVLKNGVIDFLRCQKIALAQKIPDA